MNIAGGGSEVANPSPAGAPDDGSSRGEGEDPPGELSGDASIGGSSNEGAHAGAPGTSPVPFWTEAEERVEIACFGFFDGFATFRADRAQLSAEQQELLAKQTGLPGSTYDGNDDQVHCVVTTSDDRGQKRQFTIESNSELIGTIAVAEGGAGGENGEGIASVLGCEFHHPYETGTADAEGVPFSANPLCVRELWLSGKSASYGLALPIAGKPYHLELIDCAQMPLVDTTVQLFGADAVTPIAVGVAPEEPGTGRSCLVLEAEVEAPGVARLVFNSPSGKLLDQSMIFR